MSSKNTVSIFSDDCLGGFIYKEILYEKYSSPFIWTRMYTDDFIKFIRDIENINFENFELIKESAKDKSLGILIDNKYSIFFHHVIYDKECTVPTIKNSDFGIDVHYAKPWEYILEKYTQRIKRITDKKVFVFNDVDNRISKEQINELITTAKKFNYPIIIISDKFEENKQEKLILLLRCEPTWRYEKGGWHNSIMQAHSKTIKMFLDNI